MRTIGLKSVNLRGIAFILMLLLTLNDMSAENNRAALATDNTEEISNSGKSEEAISRNLFVEFFGPSLGIGIGYDQRFKPNSAFGFRAGIAFTNGSANDSGYWDPYVSNDGYSSIDFKGVTLPLEVNAILGKRASKFELGIGATPCILDRYEIKYDSQGHIHSASDIKDGVRLNIFGTMNIGYRLQRKSGFFLRAGLTFLVGDIDCSPFDGLLCMPNISLGYTIR